MTVLEPGTLVNRYRIRESIGEGGFGVVYRAEQSEPVRRDVALKILKPGMDTRQVIGRFESERQALATMDHPYISKIFDAGETASGHPYFVMELVNGLPITMYCDQARLNTDERLELFIGVCQAVQHAHQKGIIHRDLKPSNVLVALHDDKPIPKVIDFGIAKALDRRLSNKPQLTEYRQWVGTPEYMAPEQAETPGFDIDTRADVYSLGVLLYELLTGKRPFDLTAVLELGFDEMRRALRDVDPVRPSTRVSNAAAERGQVTSLDAATIRALATTLHDELDWIVLKAMEKDRSRRYESASALALDIQRYIRNEPVEARPPSFVYRARKFTGRHRLGVTAAAIVLLALGFGIGQAFFGYAEASRLRARAQTSRVAAAQEQLSAEQARAREAEQRALAEAREQQSRTEAAKSEAVIDLIEELLHSADPHSVKGQNFTVRQLLEEFDHRLSLRTDGDPEAVAAVRATMAAALSKLDPVETTDGQK